MRSMTRSIANVASGGSGSIATVTSRVICAREAPVADGGFANPAVAHSDQIDRVAQVLDPVVAGPRTLRPARFV